MSFAYSALPNEFPRRFLSASFDSADLASLNAAFEELEKRELRSVGDLEKWLWDESELAAAVDQEEVLRFIRTSCQTDDAESEKAYTFFIENIQPLAKVRVSHLDREYLEAPARKKLPQKEYFVLDRRRANNAELFRKENVELEKEDTKLYQKYQKIRGAMTAHYYGQERTMYQLARYLEEPDRKVREEVWLLRENRPLKDKDELNEVYDQMLRLRAKIAENAGFDNYRDYAFRKKERFDYTPQDCFAYHRAVEEYVVPLLRELDGQRQDKLSVEPLRPWDLVVDMENRPPLRPFETADQLVQGCTKIFDQIGPQFGENFRRLANLGLLDLESRKGKGLGAYQAELTEVRLPFIFMNAVGRDQDVWALMHESGHAFHTFAVRDKNLLYHYRGGAAAGALGANGIPLEFAEVASQTMEIIGGEHLEGAFYDKAGAARSRRERLTQLIRELAEVALIDAFQHWIYTNQGHSREEREEQWVILMRRFGSIEDWDSFENFRRIQWQPWLHLFGFPFYFIEYGIAWTGALGLWTRYRKERAEAVQAYERALSLGGSRPLPDLFRAADLPFDFGPETIGPYANELGNAMRQN